MITITITTIIIIIIIIIIPSNVFSQALILQHARSSTARAFACLHDGKSSSKLDSLNCNRPHRQYIHIQMLFVWQFTKLFLIKQCKLCNLGHTTANNCNQTAVANKKAKRHYFQPSKITLDTTHHQILLPVSETDFESMCTNNTDTKYRDLNPGPVRARHSQQYC